MDLKFIYKYLFYTNDHLCLFPSSSKYKVLLELHHVFLIRPIVHLSLCSVPKTRFVGDFNKFNSFSYKVAKFC